jgi:hypothetical protein
MKKLYLTLTLMIVFAPTWLMGQYGNKQAGLRTGYRGGIFYQVTNESGNAEIGYNAMLSFSNNGIQLTGLRIIYETSIDEISPDLFFAWGYGVHAGFIYADHVAYMGDRYSFQHEQFCPLIGADGWLAAEYRFHEFPLRLSLNLKPYVELTIPAFVKIMPFDLGLSISYVF